MATNSSTVDTTTQFPPHWRQTFLVLWVGCFITGMGFSMTMPFISLFINELGHFSRFQLNIYSGLAFAATFISQAIVSPYWGKLADLKGRKLMCMRASGVMACTIFITGFSTNVWMIIGMRLLQGAFSGYINNATALMAGETPRSRSGWVMSTMMTAGVTGNLIGPLIGGVLSGAFGYRLPFFITGALMFIVFIGTSLLVHEHFQPVSREEMTPMSEIMAKVDNRPQIYAMFFATMMIQASIMSINPIVSLYVRELMHNTGNIAFVAGVVAATPGMGTLLTASRMGHAMDVVGPQRVLMGGLVIAALLFIPMTLTRSPWTLAAWRFALGLVSSALIPATQTVLTLSIPQEGFGRVFSYNQSFQSLGAVMGSIIGSMISGLISYPAVFAVTGCLLMVTFLVVFATRTPGRLDR